jgi:polycystin 1L2
MGKTQIPEETTTHGKGQPADETALKKADKQTEERIQIQNDTEDHTRGCTGTERREKGKKKTNTSALRQSNMREYIRVRQIRSGEEGGKEGEDEQEQRETEKRQGEDREGLGPILHQIRNNDLLTDETINRAQTLLKEQFPHTGGLQDTLNGKQREGSYRWASMETTEGVQIAHTGGNHWVSITTIGGKTIRVADSMDTGNIRTDVRELCEELYNGGGRDPMPIKREEQTPQQGNNRDCGVYAIAFATAWLHGHTIRGKKFNRPKMREHLARCIETRNMSPFPEMGGRTRKERKRNTRQQKEPGEEIEYANDHFYEIEKIASHSLRKIESKQGEWSPELMLFLKIKWKGYKRLSWVSIENMTPTEVLETYLIKQRPQVHREAAQARIEDKSFRYKGVDKELRQLRERRKEQKEIQDTNDDRLAVCECGSSWIPKTTTNGEQKCGTCLTDTRPEDTKSPKTELIELEARQGKDNRQLRCHKVLREVVSTTLHTHRTMNTYPTWENSRRTWYSPHPQDGRLGSMGGRATDFMKNSMTWVNLARDTRQKDLLEQMSEAISESTKPARVVAMIQRTEETERWMKEQRGKEGKKRIITLAETRDGEMELEDWKGMKDQVRGVELVMVENPEAPPYDEQELDRDIRRVIGLKGDMSTVQERGMETGTDTRPRTKTRPPGLHPRPSITWHTGDELVEESMMEETREATQIARLLGNLPRNFRARMTRDGHHPRDLTLDIMRQIKEVIADTTRTRFRQLKTMRK